MRSKMFPELVMFLELAYCVLLRPDLNLELMRSMKLISLIMNESLLQTVFRENRRPSINRSYKVLANFVMCPSPRFFLPIFSYLQTIF